jgi:FkbM family methyltransferase
VSWPTLFRRAGERFELRRLARGRRGRLQTEIRQATQTVYIGGGICLCRVLGRYKMYVEARDVGVSSHLMLDGYWEMWVTEVLVSRLRRGMIAIDVGANLGYFSMIMADMVGQTGKVHAFEPNPPIAELLRKSAHVNAFRERIDIHPEPLGEVDGARVRLDVPTDYPGGATINPAEGEDGDGTMTLRRLDSYPELLDADVIKIDAEGAEQSIWRGMSGIFSRGRPMVVLLEFVRSRYDDPASFLAEIAAEGFTFHQVGAGNPMRPIDQAEILAWPEHDDVMLVLVR